MTDTLLKSELEPGVYVVAVSGGVDSIALLHALQRKYAQDNSVRLVVAHFDHGIRPDSAQDRRLVNKQAVAYRLPFIWGQASLGPDASETAARTDRYDFLHKVRTSAAARAVITAHHQDDMLETAVFNLIRGTGVHGLASLRSRDIILRPLLEVSKARLYQYAQDNQLVWREDSTNGDERYTRNYIRRRLLSRLTSSERGQLHHHVRLAQTHREELESEMAAYLNAFAREGRLYRHTFITLPHAVAREVMAAWLRQQGVANFDRVLVERLVWAAKTYKIGKALSLDATRSLHIAKDFLALVSSER